jgi:branched-chain amino acid transport system substrate-binding protein
MLVTAIAVLAPVVLAACGGSTSDDGGGDASNGLKGDPIVAMTISTKDFNGPTFENAFIAAKAYETYINKQGGINDRPLKVITCDDKGSAAGAQECARQAVSEKVTAVVGAAGYYGSQIESVLAPAGVANFGGCCGFAPNEFEDPTAFTFSTDPVASNASMLIQMMNDGCKDISELSVDLPSADDTNNGSTKLLEAAGYTGGIKYIKYPVVSQDYSTQVSKAVAGGADCVGIYGAESQIAAIIPAFFATNSDAKLYGFKGNLSDKTVKGYENEDQVKNATILSLYSDLSSDPYATFRKALEDYSGTKDDLDYNSLAGLGAWTAYEGFTQVVKGISGDVTPQSFVSQATKTVIDNNGQTTSIDLSKPLAGGVAPYDKRVFNRTYFAQKLDGTAIATIDMQEFVDKL